MSVVRIVVGCMIMIVWTAVAAFQVHDLWPTLARLDMAGLATVLSAYRGELAFFWLVFGFLWLVIGYLEHDAALRRASKDIRFAVDRTDAAARLVEVEGQKLRDYENRLIRSAQPHWEVQGCIAHKEQHEITLRNAGAIASSIHAGWDKRIPMVVVLSNSTFVDRGQHLTIKVMFPEERLDEFGLTLDYSDAIDGRHTADILVSGLNVSVQHRDLVT